MDEQSHKEEMRAALRGDFERLRARRGGELPGAVEEAGPLTLETRGSEGASSAVEPGHRGGASRWLRRRRR